MEGSHQVIVQSSGKAAPHHSAARCRLQRTLEGCQRPCSNLLSSSLSTSPSRICSTASTPWPVNEMAIVTGWRPPPLVRGRRSRSSSSPSATEPVDTEDTAFHRATDRNGEGDGDTADGENTEVEQEENEQGDESVE